MKNEKRNGPDRAATASEGKHLPLSRRGFLAAALSMAAVYGGSPAHAGERPRLQGQPATTYAWEYAYVYAYE